MPGRTRGDRGRSRGTPEGTRAAGQGSSAGWPPDQWSSHLLQLSPNQPASDGRVPGQLQRGWEKGVPVSSRFASVTKKKAYGFVCRVDVSLYDLLASIIIQLSRKVFVEHHFLHKLSLPFPGEAVKAFCLLGHPLLLCADLSVVVVCAFGRGSVRTRGTS